MNKLSKDDLIRYVLLAAGVLLTLAAFILFMEKGLAWLGVLVRFVGVLLTPFLVAWLISVLTAPLTDFFRHRLHMPRSLSVLLMMLLIVGLIGAMIWLVVAVVSDVMANLAYYADNAEKYASSLLDMVYQLYNRLEFDTASLDKYLFQARELIGGWASQGADVVFGVVKATPGFVVLLFVTIVATFYWCRESALMRKFIVSALPKAYRVRGGRAYDSISLVVGGYVRAQMLLVAISISICVLGFSLVGAESALAMGLFAGVMDIIPVLGPGTLIVPWAVWSLVTGNYVLGVGLLVIYGIVSVTRYILEPKIVGDRVGIHPLAALAAIFIGMKMFGLFGLILGPIVAAVVAALLRNRKMLYEQLYPTDEPPE